MNHFYEVRALRCVTPCERHGCDHSWVLLKIKCTVCICSSGCFDTSPFWHSGRFDMVCFGTWDVLQWDILPQSILTLVMFWLGMFCTCIIGPLFLMFKKAAKFNGPFYVPNFLKLLLLFIFMFKRFITFFVKCNAVISSSSLKNIQKIMNLKKWITY